MPAPNISAATSGDGRGSWLRAPDGSIGSGGGGNSGTGGAAGATLAAGAGSGAGSGNAAAAEGSTGGVLAAPAIDPSDSGGKGALSGGSTVAVAGVGTWEATGFGFAGARGRGAAFTSRHAPRLRTYSRTSAATEVHGKGGPATAAVAPSSSAAFTSHEILRRFMALRRLRAGKAAAVYDLGYPPATQDRVPRCIEQTRAMTAASTLPPACPAARRSLRSVVGRAPRRLRTVRTSAPAAAPRRRYRRAPCA